MNLKRIDYLFRRKAGFKYFWFFKLLTLKHLTEIPGTFIRSARQFRKETGMSYPGQLWSLLETVLLFKLKAREFYFYRLDLVPRKTLRKTFISHSRYLRWTWYLNTKICGKIWWDKINFYRFCDHHQIPTVPIIAIYENGRKTTVSEAGMVDRLIVKLVNGSCGLGIERWESRDGHYHSKGKDLAPVDFESHLLERSRREDILVQPCLGNHPDINILSNGGLATVRCSTFREKNGTPVAFLPAFRMPCGDSIADNFQRNNLVASVDMQTGVLGRAFQKKHGVAVPIERHPDTCAVIAGLKLPFWDEVLALCLRAQKCCRQEEFMGWDVAITEDGPVLVEGNLSFGIEAIQVAGPLGIGSTGFLARIGSLLEEV